MKRYGIILAGALLALRLGASCAMAQDTNTLELIKQLQHRIDELEQKVKTLEGAKPPPPPATNDAAEKQRLEQLDQQVKILQHQRELDDEAAQARASVAPKISVGDQGFSFASANGNFGVQFKGVLQIDSRTFFDDAGITGNDSFLLRRARPVLQGTVFRDFDFLFVPDFGGTGGAQIFDAYLNYRYNDALQLQAGKFKGPVGLEQLQADRDLLFNERALPTGLVPNRDIGFELHGDLLGGVATYAAGIFNGVGDARLSNNADFEDDKAFMGRLMFQPFKKSAAPALQGFGFGVAGSFEDIQGTNTAALPSTTGGSLPGYATVGQQQFFAYNPTNAAVVASGEHWRVSPQGYYYFGPFGLLGEYVISNQRVSRIGTAPFDSRRLQNTGWEVTGSWVLTGEDATYGSVIPRRNFDPRQHAWGALQLVARFSRLDIDHSVFPFFADPATSARSAQEWSVGLNWYLNRNVKVMTSFSHTTFQGGGGSGSSAPALVTREAENALFTRVQLAF
ncbi:MAG TPA: porin [Candidatus Acidoferrum sp.]|jgi:phosphate-selective porin OprO/OprP|nr:porin [Candidatus Acidoferrum sp.]